LDAEAARSAAEGAGKFPVTAAPAPDGRTAAAWKKGTERVRPSAETDGASAAPRETAEASKAAETDGSAARNADAARVPSAVPETLKFSGSSFRRSQRTVPAV